MNIDSLRELAVLDGERLQALWDEIDRLRAPQAPILRVTINDQYEISSCAQYAPGLPPGDHDLYCSPPQPKVPTE